MNLGFGRKPKAYLHLHTQILSTVVWFGLCWQIKHKIPMISSSSRTTASRRSHPTLLPDPHLQPRRPRPPCLRVPTDTDGRTHCTVHGANRAVIVKTTTKVL